MRTLFVFLSTFLVFTGFDALSQTADLRPEILKFEPFVWPSEIPVDCPFAQSKEFTGIKLLGMNYMKDFGVQAYFVNIPSKFISQDGRQMWLLYSGNFSLDPDGERWPQHPPGSHYGITFQKIELLDSIESWR
jgi:hypothetical protein